MRCDECGNCEHKRRVFKKDKSVKITGSYWGCSYYKYPNDNIDIRTIQTCPKTTEYGNKTT